jgi:hypothetical protein
MMLTQIVITVDMFCGSPDHLSGASDFWPTPWRQFRPRCRSRGRFSSRGEWALLKLKLGMRFSMTVSSFFADPLLPDLAA